MWGFCLWEYSSANWATWDARGTAGTRRPATLKTDQLWEPQTLSQHSEGLSFPHPLSSQHVSPKWLVVETPSTQHEEGKKTILPPALLSAAPTQKRILQGFLGSHSLGCSASVRRKSWTESQEELLNFLKSTASALGEQASGFSFPQCLCPSAWGKKKKEKQGSLGRERNKPSP